jgi:Undecaprenyl-phosphate glucose phosphotransferase
MIHVTEELIPGITAALDGFAILLSGFAAYAIYLGHSLQEMHIYIALVVLYAMLTINLFCHAELYKSHTLGAWPTGFRRIVTLAAVGCALLIALAYCLKMSDQISRVWCLLLWSSSTFSITVIRGISKRVFELSMHRHLAGSIAVVGASDQAARWLCQLKDQNLGNRVVGVFDYRRSRIENNVSGYPVLGDHDDLVRLVRLGQLSKVVIALPWSAEQRITEIVGALREVPVTVCLTPDLIGYRFATPGGENQVPLLEVAPRPISGWSSIIKTVEDKSLAAIALLLLSPLMVVIALAIWLDSPGPVLFRQKRYGFNKQLFDVFKFRTMYHEERDENASKLTVRNDTRVTQVGRFLRRYSLDELPQLFNVLNGTMSMIGPRPHAKAAKAGGRLYQEVVAKYASRHNVRPGITGWAQVSGWRGETDNEEKIQKRVEYDLYYLENWSLYFAIRILFLTVIAVIRGENAW